MPRSSRPSGAQSRELDRRGTPPRANPPENRLASGSSPRDDSEYLDKLQLQHHREALDSADVALGLREPLIFVPSPNFQQRP